MTDVSSDDLPTADDCLKLLWSQGMIEAIDWEFARLMDTLAGAEARGDDERRALALASALVCRAVYSGNACLHLRQWAAQVLLRPGPNHPAIATPDLKAWRRALYASPVVKRPGSFAPLILDGTDRLYLYRYWDYEDQLAQVLSRRLHAPLTVDEGRLKRGVETLFDPTPEAWGQRLAACLAVLKAFCVITGGPGTGKTTTLVKILALLLDQFGCELRIYLAAPTGKAAARLQEAVARGKVALKGRVGEAVLAAIPTNASTLHRLLGPLPDGVYFRHHRDNPLGLDVLVIDEASMVDLALMTKAAWALPDHARLIMLGDRDQLASVEAGAVLAELCNGSGGYSEALAAQLANLTGAKPPTGPGTPLDDAIAALQHSYRFGGDSGIGRLARAINQGRLGQLRELLDRPPRGVQVQALGTDPLIELLQAMEKGFESYFQAVASGDPNRAFAAFSAFQVLCPQRRGPVGVERLNAAFEEGRRQALGLRGGEWYPGRAVMVTRNDYTLHLYNGDVGIALPDALATNRLRVYFQTLDGGVRSIAMTRLPAFEPAFAITVHKSQGSEFDAILLVLPPEEVPVMTRELIYTAITRARRQVVIYGNGDDLLGAVQRSIRRTSGLRDRLVNEDNNKPPPSIP